MTNPLTTDHACGWCGCPLDRVDANCDHDPNVTLRRHNAAVFAAGLAARKRACDLMGWPEATDVVVVEMRNNLGWYVCRPNRNDPAICVSPDHTVLVLDGASTEDPATRFATGERTDPNRLRPQPPLS